MDTTPRAGEVDQQIDTARRQLRQRPCKSDANLDWRCHLAISPCISPKAYKIIFARNAISAAVSVNAVLGCEQEPKKGAENSHFVIPWIRPGSITCARS